MTYQDRTNRLQAQNETLRGADNQNREGDTKAQQAIDLHEVLHHRSHQDEY